MKKQVILDNVTTFLGLNDEEKTFLKEELTLPNPKYAQAVRFSKYKNVKIPKTLEYYIESDNEFIIPSGYSFDLDEDVEVIDQRLTVPVSYPKFKLQLRGAQSLAIDKYLADTQKGLISLPTGKGKSIIGICLAQLLRQKTLVIVHKDDLVTGWSKDIELCFNHKADVGIFKANKRKVGNHFTIATIQTLSRLSDLELETFASNFGLVIVDECHHTPASTFSVINYFSARYKVGLSATLERSDGLADVMRLYFGDPCFIFKKTKEDEDILPVTVIPTALNYSYTPKAIYCDNKWVLNDEEGDTLVTDIDFKVRPQVPMTIIEDNVINCAKFKNTYLKQIKEEYNNNRNIIVFVRQKCHIELIYDLLVEVCHVTPEDITKYFGDSKEKKEDMINRIENSKRHITLATYSIATEGTNVKRWEVAFLISTIKDQKSVEQAVGRVRRTGVPDKLKTALVYDYYFPNVHIINKHFPLRIDRYKDMKCTILNSPIQEKGRVCRGFKP